jgi:hypothetical protein
MICFFLELRASLSKYIFISNLQSRLGYWNGNVLEGNVKKETKDMPFPMLGWVGLGWVRLGWVGGWAGLG